MTTDELKEHIRAIHNIYYEGDILRCTEDQLHFHKHMGELFNFAGIKETLCENNPGKMTPEKFREWKQK